MYRSCYYYTKNSLLSILYYTPTPLMLSNNTMDCLSMLTLHTGRKPRLQGDIVSLRGLEVSTISYFHCRLMYLDVYYCFGSPVTIKAFFTPLKSLKLLLKYIF